MTQIQKLEILNYGKLRFETFCPSRLPEWIETKITTLEINANTQLKTQKPYIGLNNQYFEQKCKHAPKNHQNNKLAQRKQPQK